MGLSGFLRLLLLAAIWGSSFLFMRIAAPVIGAVWVTELRVVLAAVFLAGLGFYLKKRLQPVRYAQHYLTLGFFNSAFPFLLFAYAAQTVAASLLAILNATAPIWGAVIAAASGREPVTKRTLLGLGFGIVGVVLLVGFDASMASEAALPAVFAALAASLSYGIASNYVASASNVDSFGNAQGSMWASTLFLLPLAVFYPLREVPPPAVISAVATLGILCSGIAYILYFRLIHDLGAISALSVTYLVPLFGILWGYLFLSESIGWHTLSGAVIVLTGTMLVTGFSPRALRAMLPQSK